MIGWDRINPYAEYGDPHDQEFGSFEELVASSLVVDWRDALEIAYELATRIGGYPVTGRQRVNECPTGTFYLADTGDDAGARGDLARSVRTWTKKRPGGGAEVRREFGSKLDMLEWLDVRFARA